MTSRRAAPRLILASASPRRRQFLQELGLPFTILTADMDESRLAQESPVQMVARLAAAKTQAIAERLRNSEPTPAPTLILGADTTVALGQLDLGKPADAEEAATMLHRLRLEPHQVHSAVSVLDLESNRQEIRVNTTQVHMRDYTNTEIDAYIATGDPLDKAGAYGIQHQGFAPVASLTGCAASVMGLPLADLVQILANFGLPISVPIPPLCHRLMGRSCCQPSNPTPKEWA